MAQTFNFAPAGPEFQVHTQVVGAQGGPDVAMDASGNFLVAWGSATFSSATSGEFAQRFDSTGNPIGGQFRVGNLASSRRSVAMTPDGRFIIAWDNGHEILAKRFDANGNELMPPPGIPLESGNAFIVKNGPPFGNSLPFGGGASRFRTDVAMDAAGNFIVVWQDNTGEDGSDGGVFGKRYTANGNEIAPPPGVPVGTANEFRINTYTTGLQLAPDVAMTAEGSFIVTWFSLGQDAGLGGVFAKRYDVEGREIVPPPGVQGSGVGNEFQVNSYKQTYQVGPSGDEVQESAPVATAANGDFVIAWTAATAGDGLNSQDGGGAGVYAKRYDRFGHELTPPPDVKCSGLGNEFQVHTSTCGFQGQISLAMGSTGNFIISWYGGNTLPGGGVLAQAYDAGGNEVIPPITSQGVGIGREFQVTPFPPGGQWRGRTAMDPAGNFVVVWEDTAGQDGDFSGPGAPTGIFGQRYVATPDTGPVPPHTPLTITCLSPVVIPAENCRGTIPDLRPLAVITPGSKCQPCRAMLVTQDIFGDVPVGTYTVTMTAVLNAPLPHFPLAASCQVQVVVRSPAPPIPGNIVVNGDFEEPNLVGHCSLYVPVPAGSGFIAGWNVNIPSSGTENGGCDSYPGYEHSVDLVVNPCGFYVHTGSQSVDMAGTVGTAGDSIFQDLNTVPGLSYDLIFYTSSNYDTKVNGLSIKWDGSLVDTITTTPYGTWVQHHYSVIASGSTTRLEFVGNIGGLGGAMLDTVSVTPGSNRAPIARCRDVVASASVNCAAMADINAGSSDPDPGDSISASQSPAGPYSLGNTLVTLTVTDNHGASSQCTATVTVVDNTPPQFVCPPNVSVPFNALPPPVLAATDDCDPHPVVTFVDSTTGVCPTVVTRTYTAKDASDNKVICQQLITMNNLFAADAIIWHQPLARNGASDDTDPSGGGTVKYSFKPDSTIPIQIHALGCGGIDVSSGPWVVGKIAVFADANCDGIADGMALPIEDNGVGVDGGLMINTSGHLKYNLDTKNLPKSSNCFVLKVTVKDTSTGESRSETLGLQSK